jgi:hypothetical protein
MAKSIDVGSGKLGRDVELSAYRKEFTKQYGRVPSDAELRLWITKLRFSRESHSGGGVVSTGRSSTRLPAYYAPRGQPEDQRREVYTQREARYRVQEELARERLKLAYKKAGLPFKDINIPTVEKFKQKALETAKKVPGAAKKGIEKGATKAKIFMHTRGAPTKILDHTIIKGRPTTIIGKEMEYEEKVVPEIVEGKKTGKYTTQYVPKTKTSAEIFEEEYGRKPNEKELSALPKDTGVVKFKKSVRTRGEGELGSSVKHQGLFSKKKEEFGSSKDARASLTRRESTKPELLRKETKQASELLRKETKQASKEKARFDRQAFEKSPKAERIKAITEANIPTSKITKEDRIRAFTEAQYPKVQVPKVVKEEVKLEIEAPKPETEKLEKDIKQFVKKEEEKKKLTPELLRVEVKHPKWDEEKAAHFKEFQEASRKEAEARVKKETAPAFTKEEMDYIHSNEPALREARGHAQATLATLDKLKYPKEPTLKEIRKDDTFDIQAHTDSSLTKREQNRILKDKYQGGDIKDEMREEKERREYQEQEAKKQEAKKEKEKAKDYEPRVIEDEYLEP